jgi:hypothetical protein
MDPSGEVSDVGKPIRKRLRRVSNSRAHLGFSWDDTRARELVFWLPVDGEARPNFGFVWDSREGGFRYYDWLTNGRCALSIPEHQLIFAHGTAGGKRTVFAVGRGYPGYSPGARTSRYRTGWVLAESAGPDRNSHHYLGRTVLQAEDASSDSLSISVHSDWSFDSKDTEGLVITSRAPDDDDVPIYGSAAYGTGVYRSRRHFTHEVTVDATDGQAFSIELVTQGFFRFFGVDVFSRRTQGPTGRGRGSVG